MILFPLYSSNFIKNASPLLTMVQSEILNTIDRKDAFHREFSLRHENSTKKRPVQTKCRLKRPRTFDRIFTCTFDERSLERIMIFAVFRLHCFCKNTVKKLTLHQNAFHMHIWSHSTRHDSLQGSNTLITNISQRMLIKLGQLERIKTESCCFILVH